MKHGQLNAIIVDDDIEAWQALGFSGDDVVRIGQTAIVPTSSAEDATDAHRQGIIGASIAGIGELDGLQLGHWDGQAEPAPDHANGVVAIDHVVVMTPDCDRTTASFEAKGIDARRVRSIPLDSGDRRQTFFWLGDVICEVVGPDVAQGEAPARWWGLALTVRDLKATVALLGDACTPIKSAVQPGRYVSTLRSQAGLGVPILFISEHVAAT